jgi:hypothetical protein
MPEVSKQIRILVKAPKLTRLSELALDIGGSVTFSVAPLFQSIGNASLGVASDVHWQVMTAETGQTEVNVWDLCHGMVAGEFAAAGLQGVEFAEPDLVQPWRFMDPAQEAALAASACVAAPQNPQFPTEKDPLWHLNKGHSDLAGVAELMPASGRVRIAHLDTGYDPGHETLPAGLRRDLQRNFVEADYPNDASDRTDAEALSLTNPGHGTGTLGLLAGGNAQGLGVIGGAPFAEVVPIRVANSVVLFRNSAIAQALDYVHGLCRDPATRIDVVSMSMGGLPSQAWADAVNALYEDGVVVVTAAGNNFGNLPTRQIVWPARFRRVIAACGVMADGKPYADLGISRMAGNYGPPSKMDTAIAAYTPNTPWAKRGCGNVVDLDGAGTSAATPQVAAAAAILCQRHREALGAVDEKWRRVEMVRAALFAGARPQREGQDHFGRGLLDAYQSLFCTLPSADTVEPQPADDVSFPLLRLLLPAELTAASEAANWKMLELEALQLSQGFQIEALVADCDRPPLALGQSQAAALAKALNSQPGISAALRQVLGHDTLPAVPPPPSADGAMSQLHLNHAMSPGQPEPVRRRLWAFAYDPLLATQLENIQINQAILDIPWEKDLQPGPVGEYLEVIDVDPPSNCCYAPVDLNHRLLLNQNGLAPSEANPQFHQQMVYAVAMRTIERFERALGRRAQWSSRLIAPSPREHFVRRLRIYPHALREANAYYSPDRKALLFGYFNAAASDMGTNLPGGQVFGCLSHDIIAHETTHALLDGLHPRFREASNLDILAFHEAFADIVALFQHFSMPEALRHQLSRCRGDLSQRTLLAELAQQFGQATRRGQALRSAVKKDDPKATDYESATEPHDRGAVLVGAVFAAFLRIYERRAAQLMGLASNGTGIMPDGALPPALVDELATTAAKVADQVLTICIRALDYCPPVDITFGDYLRALITADRDLVPDDKRLYRVAFISSFRDRGIYPSDVQSLSVDSLTWEEPPIKRFGALPAIMAKMSPSWTLRGDREEAWQKSKENAVKFQKWLMDPEQVSDAEIGILGLLRKRQPETIAGVPGKFGGIEVHSIRPARRIGQDGSILSDLVVELIQAWRPDDLQGIAFRGGCTLLINRDTNEIRYLIRKRVDNEARLMAQLKPILAATERSYFDSSRRVDEPFAMLHCAH